MTSGPTGPGRPHDRRRRLLAGGVALWMGLCGAATLASEPSPAGAAVPADLLARLWPVSTEFYPTTSGEIYLGNLDSRITAMQSRLDAGQTERSEALAGALYHRYKVVGRIEDAERAFALLERRAAEDALSPEGMVLYATALSGLHRFDAAKHWLSQAHAQGADARRLHGVAMDIAVARGDYGALRDELAHSLEPADDFYLLAHRADLRLLQGDLAGASHQYLAAQTVYRDVNPVPLAWLHVQMGIALLRSGEVSQARRFFERAVERLPGYYLAEEHLAECEAALGATDAARRRYQRVIEQTGNPEFIAALAALERKAGRRREADRLQEEALRGYEASLERHPDAFGQHAAEFLLEIGQAERADALARANLRLRQDVGSWILQASTALAAGDTARACAARNAAVATALLPPELAEVDALAPRCR